MIFFDIFFIFQKIQQFSTIMFDMIKLKTRKKTFSEMGVFMKYEINEGTLAILPLDVYRSKVLEDEVEYVIEENPYQIMDDSCRYFGSSYKGRKEGARSILGEGYKIPILVEDGRNIVFFPTVSPSAHDCIWIASKKIKCTKYIDELSSKIIFDNSKEIEVPISKRSLDNQLLRATRLESVVRNRKNSNNMQF